jgi:hypothetical protein
LLEAVEGEIQLLAIGHAGKGESQSRWFIALGKEVAEGKEIPKGFGHLFAFNQKVFRMEPVTGEWFSGSAFALRDFIFVMRESEVDTTGVNVQCFAEIFHSHGRALDVPAWAARADSRLPEMLAFFWRFPESKIANAFFFLAVVINARSFLNSGEVNIGKFSVGRKFCNPVVDRAIARVGIGFFLKPLNELNHVFDMVGDADPVFRGFDVQSSAVVEKGLSVFFSVFAKSFSDSGCVGDDAVVYVGEVHDMIHFVAAESQKAAQDILKNKSAIVADVGKIVDRGAAGVHANFTWSLRHEGFEFARQGVVEEDFGHRVSVNSKGARISRGL